MSLKRFDMGKNPSAQKGAGDIAFTEIRVESVEGYRQWMGNFMEKKWCNSFKIIYFP
jgi:hypothetical protein